MDKAIHTIPPDTASADLPDALEAIAGEAMRVNVRDEFTLTFGTARERLCWADGFRQGERFASNVVAIVDWLEAWLHEQKQTDAMEREGAARRVAICAEKMSPSTRDRAAKLAQALTHWRESSRTK